MTKNYLNPLLLWLSIFGLFFTGPRLLALFGGSSSASTTETNTNTETNSTAFSEVKGDATSNTVKGNNNLFIQTDGGAVAGALDFAKRAAAENAGVQKKTFADTARLAGKVISSADKNFREVVRFADRTQTGATNLLDKNSRRVIDFASNSNSSNNRFTKNIFNSGISSINKSSGRGFDLIKDVNRRNFNFAEKSVSNNFRFAEQSVSKNFGFVKDVSRGNFKFSKDVLKSGFDFADKSQRVNQKFLTENSKQVARLLKNNTDTTSKLLSTNRNVSDQNISKFVTIGAVVMVGLIAFAGRKK